MAQLVRMLDGDAAGVPENIKATVSGYRTSHYIYLKNWLRVQTREHYTVNE